MHKSSIEFARRAEIIARRDGIPDMGSHDVRVHSPLRRDNYISTERAMASFRTAKGMPLALLERLWADGEHTHIVDRTAIVINLDTGKIVDAGLFFQREAGDYTSIVSYLEIGIDRARKDIDREKRKKNDGFDERVQALIERRACHIELLGRFERAGTTFGITLSPDLIENRELFGVAPKSQIAHYPAERHFG